MLRYPVYSEPTALKSPKQLCSAQCLLSSAETRWRSNHELALLCLSRYSSSLLTGATSSGSYFSMWRLASNRRDFVKCSESSRKPSNRLVRNQCLDDDSCVWCVQLSPNRAIVGDESEMNVDSLYQRTAGVEMLKAASVKRIMEYKKNRQVKNSRGHNKLFMLL